MDLQLRSNPGLFNFFGKLFTHAPTLLMKYGTLRPFYSGFDVTHTHAHNRFTALLEFVLDHPGEQVPER